MTTITNNNLSLNIIKKPEAKDIKLIKKQFSFHPSILSELAHPTLHPMVESYDNQAFLVLRFPQFDSSKNTLVASEIDFIIEKDQLTIVQYKDFEPLDTLLTQMRHGEEKHNEFFSANSGYLLYKIIDYLFKSLYDQLDHIAHKVDEIEDIIFKDKEEKTLRLISLYRREAIDFRRTIKPNTDIFQELIKAFSNLFNPVTSFYLNTLEATNARFMNLIENHIETLQVLHETNESLLSNKINEVMKILTLFAVIVFPLTLLSSIWGMNTINMPLTNHPFGFWIILGTMGLGVLLMLLFFKLKKWL